MSAGPDLSALVSARLCHDLISPMGAIGNGLELMQLSQPAVTAELDLVAGSLGSALAKLRFFRIAFGPSEAQGRLSTEEIRAVTDAMFSGRFSVDWDADAPDLSRGAVKIAFLALLCVEKSLPMGGAACVAARGEAIAVTAEGRRTAPPAALWDLVAEGGETDGLRPDGVQFALLRRALDEAGGDVEIAFSDTAASVRMTAPEPGLEPAPAETPA